MSNNEKMSAESNEMPGDSSSACEGADKKVALLEEEEISEAEALKVKLEQALSDAKAAREDMLRARAEADNIRKRAARDVANAHKFGLERFITELLPVKDSMDLGFEALDTASDVDAIREGMALTRKIFDDALEKSGVKPIDPTGKVFDPEFHQAMTMEPSCEVAGGTVLRVMQMGYVLNDRLIRPAMVIVAKAVDEGDA